MYEKQILGILSNNGLGIQTFHELLNYYGGIEELIKNAYDNNIYKDTKLKITNNLDLDSLKIQKYYDELNKNSVDVISYWNENYPSQLQNINFYPPILHFKGDIDIINKSPLGIAVVGSRKMSMYGKKVAYELGSFLANHNIPVISGLAYGVDCEVHKAVVDANGVAIGVLANGLDKIYPSSNTKLANKILDRGVLLTEEFLYSDIAKYKFPIRNRIISGIAKAVVIVEADVNSGSMITAKHALNQGRTVYAVPGSIYSSSSSGTNRLILDGAIPLLNFNQLLYEYGEDYELRVKSDKDKLKDISDEFKIILENLNLSDMSLDELSKANNKDISQMSVIMMKMELDGLVTSFGDVYSIK